MLVVDKVVFMYEIVYCMDIYCLIDVIVIV